MIQFQRVLHPTDFSKASGPAFTKAVRLAKQNHAELILVHVLPPVLPPGYADWRRTYWRIGAQERRFAQSRLSALLARARRAKVRGKVLILSGVTYDEIVRAARSERADLIVMGSHGWTGLKKLLMGSVAERVVGLSPCPVLIVRGRKG
jgi:nucleotide-binding universal stress UspA family protein